MSDTFDGIDKALNITSEIITTDDVIKPTIITNKTQTEDIKSDYEYTRGQLYNLIAKGTEAIDSALEVAQSSDHPRAYEVAGNLIKNVADITDKLLDLQKKIQDIEDPKQKTAQNITNNTMFVGSTADLAKMLKKQNNSQDK
jgi:hypothetical protein